jgi:hypothetical protein
VHRHRQSLRHREHPERLRNLYFVFLFVTRALAKVAPALTAEGAGGGGGVGLADGFLSTGDAAEDARTRELLGRLVRVEAPAVLAGFDERLMFAVHEEDVARRGGGGGVAGGLHGASGGALAAGAGGDAEQQRLSVDAAVAAAADIAALAASKEALRASLRGRYRNISRIMDCVGCEKCRLWGKLQFLGLGTAMKLLFSDGQPSEEPPLSRNELVALVNVLHRLSMSLSAIGVFRELEARRKLHELTLRAAGAAVALLAALVAARVWLRRRRLRRAGEQAAGRQASKAVELAAAPEAAKAAGGRVTAQLSGLGDGHAAGNGRGAAAAVGDGSAADGSGDEDSAAATIEGRLAGSSPPPPPRQAAVLRRRRRD